MLHITNPNPLSLCTLSSKSIEKIISKLHFSNNDDGFLLIPIIIHDIKPKITPIEECRKRIFMKLIEIQNMILNYNNKIKYENSPYSSDDEEECKLYKDKDYIDWKIIKINLSFDDIKDKKILYNIYENLNEIIINNSQIIFNQSEYRYLMLLNLSKSRLANISNKKNEMNEYLWDVLLDYLHDTIPEIPNNLLYSKDININEIIKLYRMILSKYRELAKVLFIIII